MDKFYDCRVPQDCLLFRCTTNVLYHEAIEYIELFKYVCIYGEKKSFFSMEHHEGFMCRWHILGMSCVVQWFSTGIIIFFKFFILPEVFGNVWRYFGLLQLCSQELLLVGRGQGCCRTSYKAQDSVPNKNSFLTECQ